MAFPELAEQAFDTGEVILNYAEGPAAGLPLVLLHGGSARWQAFESIIPELAARYHLYAPDLRGHGRSGWTEGRYRLRDYATDIIALIRHRIGQPAFMVGHSLGGMVALLVAAICPDCARAVVVGDSPLGAAEWQAAIAGDRPGLRRWSELSGGARRGSPGMAEIIRVLQDAPLRVPGQREPLRMADALGPDSPIFSWLAANLYQHDPAMLLALLDRFDEVAAGYEMEQVLPAIRCPVLLLQADPAAGGAMTDAEVERGLALLRHPAHVRLSGIGHVLHNEQKEPVLQAILGFLASLQRQA